MSSQVLADDETHCLALSVRAASRIAGGKARSALTDAQRSATQCPGRSQGWAQAAAAYTSLGDDENARRVWRQGIEANPQDPELARHYITWLLDNGGNREAVATARRLTIVAPASMAGWRLYRATCREARENCVGKAAAGLNDASTRYGVDLKPGEKPPNGLFGRLVAR